MKWTPTSRRLPNSFAPVIGYRNPWGKVHGKREDEGQDKKVKVFWNPHKEHWVNLDRTDGMKTITYQRDEFSHWWPIPKDPDKL